MIYKKKMKTNTGTEINRYKKISNKRKVVFMAKIKILKNKNYYYTDGYFTDENFVIISELIEADNKEFEKMMLTNTPVQAINGKVELLSNPPKLKELANQYSENIKDTNELIPLNLMTTSKDNRTLIIFYNKQAKHLVYIDKRYLDLFPSKIKLYQTDNAFSGCSCSLDNTYLGVIMPVYMKNSVLPKELALVERELISELDNVEIY